MVRTNHPPGLTYQFKKKCFKLAYSYDLGVRKVGKGAAICRELKAVLRC